MDESLSRFEAFLVKDGKVRKLFRIPEYWCDKHQLEMKTLEEAMEHHLKEHENESG